MAIVNYSPWTEAANYGAGLGNQLTNLLIQLPQLRQQQMLNQAHADLYRQQIAASQAGVTNEGTLTGARTDLLRQQILESQGDVTNRSKVAGAQAGYYDAGALENKAHAGLYEVQKGEITSSEANKVGLGQAFRNFADAERMGLDSKRYISDMVDHAARLPLQDRSQIMEQVSQAIEMSSPRYRKALGLGSQMTMDIGPGGTAYNNLTEKPEYQSPRIVGPGQDLYDPGTDKVIASGRDRPFSPQNMGGVYGAFAREAAAQAFEQNVPAGTALQQFMDKVNSLSPAQTALGPPPGRGTNDVTGPVRPRFNPATRKVEVFDPQTGQWKPR